MIMRYTSNSSYISEIIPFWRNQGLTGIIQHAYYAMNRLFLLRLLWVIQGGINFSGAPFFHKWKEQEKFVGFYILYISEAYFGLNRTSAI